MHQPVLRRERVTLRPWRDDDVDFVLSVASDPLTGLIRVAESAGFEKEGLMKPFAPLNGERRDAYLFARTAQRPIEASAHSCTHVSA